ncbi:MAG TPA: roadblock/LC7 domain-containing protein [Thermodesulfovibrionales bacterium]|nr:roadblock/LC7 domain-containing protein [Thermodesulfovibrionales bacterium]
MESNLVMYEGEFRRIDEELRKLYQQTNAKVLFLIDKNGQLIASAGDTYNLDTTALASLTAGNIAATGGIARLLGEREFTVLFHEGDTDNIHITLIGQRVILVVIFDQRSSLGLVRLRVKKSSEAIAKIFEEIAAKADREKSEGRLDESPFAEISDEDIDNLFR